MNKGIEGSGSLVDSSQGKKIRDDIKGGPPSVSLETVGRDGTQKVFDCEVWNDDLFLVYGDTVGILRHGCCLRERKEGGKETPASVAKSL